MSTRYVWSKNKPNPPDFAATANDYKLGVKANVTPNNGALPILCKAVEIKARETPFEGGYFYPVGDYIIAEAGKFYSCAEYPYAIIRWGNYTYGISCAYNTTGYYYTVQAAASDVTKITYRYLSASEKANLYYMSMPATSSFSKGEFEGYLSASSRSAYTSGLNYGKYAYEDAFWVEYIGSDNIDPTAITYGDRLRGSEPVTVSITPQTGTYGGTISYNYQYSIDGGKTWTAIKTTTETSIQFDIPANAKTIRFRVRASDDIGFVSTDFVTGAAATVEWLNLWIGVNGKARKGAELYVGVNGKARKVTAAYIGVNGKARRFL